MTMQETIGRETLKWACGRQITCTLCPRFGRTRAVLDARTSVLIGPRWTFCACESCAEELRKMIREDAGFLAQLGSATITTWTVAEQPIGEWARQDAPREGKRYRITGAPGKPSVANGDSWADSEVTE